MTKFFHILVEEVLSFAFRNKQNVRQTSNAYIFETRQDIKISSTYLASVANLHEIDVVL